MAKRGRKPDPNKIILPKRKAGRKPDPSRLVTPAQIEQHQIRLTKKAEEDKYKKLQLYYYFAIGREYLDLGTFSNYERSKIYKKLEILDKLNIPHVLGEEKILSPGNLTDWVENLYQHRLELKKLGVKITSKTRLAGAAKRIVRLFGLEIVYLYRRLENGLSVSHYKGANSHCDADKEVLNGWLERDRQAAIGRLHSD